MIDETQNPQHTLGFRAHYRLPSWLQKIASDSGLEIRHLGGDHYKVSFKDKNLNLDHLRPDFVESDGYIFDLENLKSFLEFLHQPVRAGLDKALVEQQAHRKFKNSERHEQRKVLHRILRFATSDSVILPHERYAHLEIDIEDEHFAIEASLRTSEKWHIEPEIGNPRSVQSAIPNTVFDPEKGFCFTFSEAMLQPEQLGGIAQQQLSNHIWAFLKNATHGRIAEPRRDIQLSGTEMVDFCRLAARDHEILAKLAHSVEQEGTLHAHERSIQRRVDCFSGDLPVSFFKEQAPSKQTLHNLLRATTALTPPMMALRDVWKTYHYTERYSPVDDVLRQIEMLEKTIQAYEKQDSVSHTQAEALIQEFFPLLAFAVAAARTMGNGFQHKKVVKMPPGFASSLSAHFLQVADTIENSSAAGVSLNPMLMDKHYREILSVLALHTGQKKFDRKELLKIIGASLLRFGKDITIFVREHPKTSIALMVGLFTISYLMNGGNGQTSQSAANLVLTLGDDGLEKTTVALSSLSQENLTSLNYHWHFSATLGTYYKSFKSLYNAAVTETSQMIFEAARATIQTAYMKAGISINPDCAFSKAANGTITYLAEKMTGIMVFQDLTHAGFWGLLATNGYKYGLKSKDKISELLAPVIDLAYMVGSKTAGRLGLGTYRTLSDRIMSLAGGIKDAIPASVHGFDVLNAVEGRRALAESQPDSIGAVNFTLKAGYLKQSFRIGAENWVSALESLGRFDFMMEYMTERTDVPFAWREKLRTNMLNVRRALDDYKLDGNCENLQNAFCLNLGNLMQAEMHVRGSSPLYSVFSQEPDAVFSKKLIKIANRQFKATKRDALLQEQFEKLRPFNSPSLSAHFKARATIAGATAVQHIAKVMQILRDATEILPSGIRKNFIRAAAAVSVTTVAFDMAGQGNEISDAISSLTATGLATTTFVSLYAFWNWGQDIVQNHIGIGAIVLTASAAVGAADQKLLRPLTKGAREAMSSKQSEFPGFLV
ncbi:MAG: hypothetical protein ACT4OY_01605 [Alphaproteobacteria bacterium]